MSHESPMDTNPTTSTTPVVSSQSVVTGSTVDISQLLPQQNQQTVQQSILPAINNKSLLEQQKGKPFMLSHSAAIQPKSAINPATSISSPLLANSQFKTHFSTNANTTQLIATQSPNNLIANQQIFQTIPPGLTWTTGPQSTHLVGPNGSPIFIRGQGQGGEHILISTSNMQSPQMQTVSMGGPINVQNSVHTPIQVSSSSTHTHSSIAPTPIQSAGFQTMSVTSNANPITSTTPVISSQSMASGSTVVISQLIPQQNQHSVQQSILPANQKGKPFGTGSVRSAFANKILSHSAAIQPKSPILPATSISSPLLANSQFKSPFPPNANTAQLIATQQSSNLLNPQILGSFPTIPGFSWAASPQSTHLVGQNMGSPFFIRSPGQGGGHMFISNLSSPQIQTISMGQPINVQNSVHSPIQVSSASPQSSLAPTPIQSSQFQTISVSSNANTTTSNTPVHSSQSVASGPMPISNTTKILRQFSSMATQTANPASAQKVESTTNLKPIAPAKPKPSPQQLIQNKQIAKDLNSIPIRSVSVGTTQTVNQQPDASPQTRPPSNKSDASNQTIKVSVATETPKVNSQVSSSRASSDQNRQMNVKTNTNTNCESSESKVNSVSEPIKTPLKRPVVEKKDASTEQDMELSATLFAQNNHKSVPNSVQTTTLLSNNVSQANGQIPVLSDLNRQDLSKQPQKAIVKPQKSQILTHVIDGYIIKESANPFPVNGLSYGSDTRIIAEDKTNNNSIESIKLKNKNENTLNSSASSSKKTNSERHLCLNCGAKRKSNSKNNRTLNKRFCSQTCSEKFTSTNKNGAPVGTPSRLLLYNSVTGHLDDDDTQRGQELTVEPTLDSLKQNLEERKKSKISKKIIENSTDFNATKNGDLNIGSETNHQKIIVSAISEPVVAVNSVPSIPTIPIPIPSNASISEESTNSAIAGLYIPPGGRNPLQWTVNDVYEFVRNLQGCTEYADEFRSQEIDGQALMLIKEDHLMNTMNMKLGPALKICSKINALREDVQKQS